MNQNQLNANNYNTKKIIFFNIGWMDLYQGLSDNDAIIGGGKHIDLTGWGGEVYNFQSYRNKNYGYVQPRIDRKYKNPSTIKIEKLGASTDDMSIKDVTVVFTASDPYKEKKGTFIVGWYKNATVFRNYQSAPLGSNRKLDERDFGYFAVAKKNDVQLLTRDQRIVEVKRREKNWMGQSNVWYADKNPTFIKTVINYIFHGILPNPKRPNTDKRIAFQKNSLLRIEVEKKAILTVSEYYSELGYEIKSVEKDNIGWDLWATNDITKLKLEVKGLSGNSISTELTPNEYKNLQEDLKFYRLCIVTNALNNPILRIFAHSKENNCWISDDGIKMIFEEKVSARIFV